MINKIKAAQLLARKQRDSEVASLLTTIIGEAEMIGKNEGRPATDLDYISTLKKFEKNMVDNIRLYENAGNFDASTMEDDALHIIRHFLPEKLSDLQLEKDISVFMVNNSTPKEMKSMGIVSKHLKELYGEQYDGKQVSEIFKRVIS